MLRIPSDSLEKPMSCSQALLPRRAVWVAGVGVLWSVAAAQSGQEAAQAPEPLLFLGFDLQDEQPDPARATEHTLRLAAIGLQLREGLTRLGLYRDVATTPDVDEAVRVARAQTEYLYRCNNCLGPVAQAAGTRLVGLGWVQRVSNLILNINLEFRDAREDRMVLTKSVDIRGDNDESWRRGVAYMLRDMAERRQRQPRYGL